MTPPDAKVGQAPVVFWGPPDLSSRIMSTPFSPQEFSRFQFHAANQLLYTFSTSSPHSRDSFISLHPQETDNEESENDNFFDCDSDNNSRQQSPLTPKVHVVSKTHLKEFDSEPAMRPSRSDRSSSAAKNRNSASSLHNVDIDKQQKVKVKKCSSQHEIKLVKAPILSSSSFSRVFSPFSPSVKKGSSPSPDGNQKF